MLCAGTRARLFWLLPISGIMLLGLFSVALTRNRSGKSWGLQSLVSCPTCPDGLHGGALWEQTSSGFSPPSWQLPIGYQAANSTIRMLFAQVADGALPGTNRFYQTSFMLVNDSDYDVAGFLKFYDDNGAPLRLTIGTVTDSSIPISLNKNGQMKRITTSGSGQLKTGWAAIETSQPLKGTASFGIRDADGKVYSDVGVSESLLGNKFTIFADSIGTAYTGLAVVNPSDTDSIVLNLDLFDNRGAAVSSTTQNLGPKAHVARFLNEFFPKLANIDEFEGSLVITAQGGKKFAGITLRLNGDQFTSLPMVMPPAAGSTKSALYFPQIADGLVGQLKYATSVILINNTTDRATGKLEFFKSDSTAMTVTIGGQAATSFDFTLAPGAVTRMVTSGAGDAKVGWGRVAMDKPISGTAVFHVFNSQGSALAEVGVNSADPITKFNLIADSIGFFDTGIALANPDQTNQTYVGIDLVDGTGKFVASNGIYIGAGKHQALYMTQLFSYYRGIDEFEGLIKVAGDLPLIPLTLRSINEKLTSVPVLNQAHGFAPDAAIDVAQNLTATSPAMRWQFHLNGNDLAINSMKITAPGFKLQPTGLSVGKEIGYGTFIMQGGGSPVTGLVRVIVTSLNPLQFYAAGANSLFRAFKLDALELFSCTAGTSGNAVVFDFTSLQLGVSQWNGGMSADLDLYLRPDVFISPSAAGNATITIDYISASGFEDYLEPKVSRTSSHPLAFIAADAARANITNISPLMLTGGEGLTLKGTNFGANPKVVFSAPKNQTITAWPITSDASSLLVIVPQGVVDGPVRVDNGSGPGNGYSAKALFAPAVDLQFGTATADGVPFTLSFAQQASELPMTSCNLTLLGADRSWSSLAANAVVGSCNVTVGNTTTPYRLVATYSDTTQLYITVCELNSLYPSSWGHFVVTKPGGAAKGLNFNYMLSSPSVGSILTASQRFEMVFSGFPVQLPAGAKGTSASGTIQSGPAGLGGMNSAMTVTLSR